MTLKSLLGSAAIVALAMAATAPGALAGDPNKPAATQGSAATDTSTSTSTSTSTQGSFGTTGQTTGTETSMKSSAQVSLSSVTNPAETLASASVQDAQGNSIGPVKKIVTGSNGKATAVNVDIGGKVVAIKASKLKFQQDKNVLVTTMTKDQINAMPQAKGI